MGLWVCGEGGGDRRASLAVVSGECQGFYGMPAGQAGAGSGRRKAGHQEAGGDIVGGREDEGGAGDDVGG